MKLKPKFLFFFLFNIVTFFCFSQNETKKWFFGQGCGLNFSSGSPTLITGGALTTSLGCASIADANGNLLFYTDGATIYNQLHTSMANGTGLFGGGVAQSAIILKKPASTNLYYVFTLRNIGLSYSIVDMSLASGNGSVVTKNIPLLNATMGEKLTAGKHCNGSDYWVLCTSNNTFISYSLTAAGINTLGIVSPIAATTYTNSNGSATVNPVGINNGCMKLSPNGRKLLVTSSLANLFLGSGNANCQLILYDFDNTNGNVSNGNYVFSYGTSLVGIASSVARYFPYGCEFSPDGHYAYYSALWPSSGIGQVDVCSPVNSFSILETGSSETGGSGSASYSVIRRSFQLASDGKIYIEQGLGNAQTTSSYIPTNSLSVILNPNATGSLAAFSPLSQSLGTYSAQWGLPNHPGFYFEQKPTPNFTATTNSSSGCTNHTFIPAQICSGTGYSVTGYQWNFGDPGSGSANTSFLMIPTHSFSTGGSHTVQLVRSFNCFTDTIVKVITLANPSLSIATPSIGCGVNTATANVSNGIGPYTYSWANLPYMSPAVTVSLQGTYTVTVTDEGSGCVMTKTVFINNVVLNPSITTSYLSCFGNSNASATLGISGGSGTYSYTWSNSSQNTSSTSNLSAGIYSVIAFDLVNTCTVSKTYTIVQPAPITIQFLSPANTCIGLNATITASVSGGSWPYLYNFGNGISISNTLLVNQNLPGTTVYTLNCIDAHNCSQSNTVAIQFISPPQLSVNNFSFCAGQSCFMNLSLANTATWQPGNFVGNTYSVNLTSNTIFTVSCDSAGCVSSNTLLASRMPLPTLSINNVWPLCEGQTLVFNCNSNANQFYWIGPNLFSTSVQNPTIQNVSMASAGIYSLSAVDSNSCETKINVPVTINPNPTLTVTGQLSICAGESTTLTANGAYYYLWSTGSGNSVTVINPLSTVIHTVSGTLISTNCSSTNTVNIIVNKCTAINELETDKEVEVFPNPATSKVILNLNKSYKLEIYNQTGQLIFSNNLESGLQQLDVSEYTNSIYLLRLMNEQAIIIKKLQVWR